MSYGADRGSSIVGFVDKILKDAKPAEFPVEQPTKFELAIKTHRCHSITQGRPPKLRFAATGPKPIDRPVPTAQA